MNPIPPPTTPDPAARILILGLAYKPNIDDVRESPSFELIEQLTDLGAKVDYSDPHVAQTHTMRKYDLKMQSVPISPSMLASYDAAIVSTHHAAFDWPLITEHSKLIVDTRGVLRSIPNPRATIITA